jgi:hypothetical protein
MSELLGHIWIQDRVFIEAVPVPSGPFPVLRIARDPLVTPSVGDSLGCR